MRGASLATAALVALAAAAPAADAAPKARWTALADCAGAYQANSRVADADRPASMVAQMSDTAEDYAKAGRAAYQRQTNASAAKTRAAVAGRVAATAQRLAGQPREAAERVIDACPQPDG
jgi:hypothetical protein